MNPAPNIWFALDMECWETCLVYRKTCIIWKSHRDGLCKINPCRFNNNFIPYFYVFPSKAITCKQIDCRNPDHIIELNYEIYT